MLGTILIIVLIFALLGALPRKGRYSASWGYYPSGGIGLIVLIVVILVLMGQI